MKIIISILLIALVTISHCLIDPSAYSSQTSANLNDDFDIWIN